MIPLINHDSQWGRSEVVIIYPDTWTVFYFRLPSGNSTSLWKITIFNGKIHYKWPFSIAMLVYQRVAECIPSCFVFLKSNWTIRSNAITDPKKTSIRWCSCHKTNLWLNWNIIYIYWLVVEPYPSEKYEFVSWDYCSQYTEKRKMFQTTNQICIYIYTVYILSWPTHTGWLTFRKAQKHAVAVLPG